VLGVGVTLLTLGACSSSSDSATANDSLGSLRSALGHRLDSKTQAALGTLILSLNARDWAYLSYAHWPADQGQAALSDPTLRKALSAESAGSAALSRRPQAATQVTKYDEAQWAELYTDATELMAQANSIDFAGSPGAAAAWVKLLSGALSNQSGSILPDPKLDADGNVAGCGASFYDGTGKPTASCSAISFCCQGAINFDDGTTFCHDFESCRAKPPPPLLTMKAASNPAAAAACSLAGVSDAGRVPACDCQIGFAHYDVPFADPSSSTGGHWCCAAYSTGPDCPAAEYNATCFYVDRASDGKGCCAALPRAPPAMCTDFDDPTVVPELNGAPVCCPR
jgi:hypothetical protein